MKSEREQLEVAYLDLQEKCRPFQVCLAAMVASFEGVICKFLLGVRKF